MGYPKLIEWNQKEESISIQRAKYVLLWNNISRSILPVHKWTNAWNWRKPVIISLTESLPL